MAGLAGWLAGLASLWPTGPAGPAWLAMLTWPAQPAMLALLARLAGPGLPASLSTGWPGCRQSLENVSFASIFYTLTCLTVLDNYLSTKAPKHLLKTDQEKDETQPATNAGKERRAKPR